MRQGSWPCNELHPNLFGFRAGSGRIDTWIKCNAPALSARAAVGHTTVGAATTAMNAVTLIAISSAPANHTAHLNCVYSSKSEIHGRAGQPVLSTTSPLVRS